MGLPNANQKQTAVHYGEDDLALTHASIILIIYLKLTNIESKTDCVHALQLHDVL